MIAHPTRTVAAELAETIQSIVESHGAWRVLRAALAAALWRKRPPPFDDAEALSDHMRRDIGLLPRESSYWDIR